MLHVLRSMLENPVARHARRLSTGRRWGWGVALLLVAAALVGLLLQKYWMELEIYSFLQPRSASRWMALTLLSETVLALPWAAIRGAALWRRLKGEGHLEEYRRSRLSAASIAAGVLGAALFPVLVLLLVSLLLALAVAQFTGGLPVLGVLGAHALLLSQVLAFAALGLCLAGITRHPAFAVPLAVLLLAGACTAIWGLNPFLRSVPDPAPYIYAALLPNPVTAVGNALETDVLRFSWVYERVRAVDYFYIYPPVWQTGSFYLTISVLALALTGRRIAREE